ncbi:MAG: dienelactone hydrolase family protein [Firmicutes bacterium]|nr:dienelactone hydrolase family protein [Bacillota bacterium]
MLTYLNNSTTVVIVLHEIYGINEHIIDTCERLSQAGVDVLCPDMLGNRKSFSYEQEDKAYSFFMNQIGFEMAFSQIRNLINDLKGRYKTVCTVGYSAGATVAWLCSGEKGLCDAAIGFYGSRIRDHLEVEPKCPVLLFFPSQEKSFNVHHLTSILTKKENVQVKTYTGKHGFADPYSKNYCPKSTDHADQDMTTLLNRIS